MTDLPCGDNEQNVEYYDVFLSYAHDDNETLEGIPIGFVTRLCRYIKKFGKIRRGKPITIFFDAQMATGTPFADAIEQALEKTLLFLPVVSSSWQESVWCQRELEKRSGKIFPILFESNARDVSGYLGQLHMRHSFQFGMTNEEFNKACRPMVEELVDQLEFLEGRARTKAGPKSVAASAK